MPTKAQSPGVKDHDMPNCARNAMDFSKNDIALLLNKLKSVAHFLKVFLQQKWLQQHSFQSESAQDAQDSVRFWPIIGVEKDNYPI